MDEAGKCYRVEWAVVCRGRSRTRIESNNKNEPAIEFCSPPTNFAMQEVVIPTMEANVSTDRPASKAVKALQDGWEEGTRGEKRGSQDKLQLACPYFLRVLGALSSGGKVCRHAPVETTHRIGNPLANHGWAIELGSCWKKKDCIFIRLPKYLGFFLLSVVDRGVAFLFFFLGSEISGVRSRWGHHTWVRVRAGRWVLSDLFPEVYRPTHAYLPTCSGRSVSDVGCFRMKGKNRHEN